MVLIEFGVTPDIMTMAKATTNGVVPMGVVACNDFIYDAVMDASPTGMQLNYFMVILIQEFQLLLLQLWQYKIFLKKMIFLIEQKI